jgi:hypothetical protein
MDMAKELEDSTPLPAAPLAFPDAMLCPLTLPAAARVSHQLEDLGTAFRHYKEATQLNPDLEPALFGYAQVRTHRP